MRPSWRSVDTQARQTRVRCLGDSPHADPELALNRTIFAGNTKYPALKQAEKDIKAYCERVGDADEAQKCYATLQRLEQEERKAFKGMEVLENAVSAEAALERLESMARQLANCGGTKMMVDALYHLQEKQALAAAGAAVPQRKAAPAADGNALRARARLREVFERVDGNGDGAIDIAEFRNAMDFLGKHLDGPAVSEICQALDIHGGVDFEQFCDIVDAEDVYSPEAPRLRAILHNSSDDKYKDWIDSWG